MGEIDWDDLAVIEQLLPELMVMARARHADRIIEHGVDISYCGIADSWEQCCTILPMESINGQANMHQCMLWYNIDKDTKAVAVEVNINRWV